MSSTSSLRAVPARPKAGAESAPNFGHLADSLRHRLHRTGLVHGDIEEMAEALRGVVGEDDVYRQIRGARKPSLAVFLAALHFANEKVRVETVDGVAALVGRTTVPHAPSFVEERHVVAQITATMASAARAFSDVLQRADNGIDAEEAKECVPGLNALKQEVARLDLLVMSALTGDGR
jgi:hypothetical protein